MIIFGEYLLVVNTLLLVNKNKKWREQKERRPLGTFTDIGTRKGGKVKDYEERVKGSGQYHRGVVPGARSS